MVVLLVVGRPSLRCALLLSLLLLVSLALLALPTTMAAPGSTRRLLAAFKPSPEAHRLADFLQGKNRVVTITGAGISTESGIPDYRGPDGSYSRGHTPMKHDEFCRSDGYHRKRYWARSFVGYRRFSRAAPNDGHRALARMEKELGIVQHLITQNVDGLHQRAGSERVMDLHGRNDRIVCLGCGRVQPRRPFQQELEQLNAAWIDEFVPRGGEDARMFADGDADLTQVDFNRFQVPSCPCCGGVLKPDVVFFGDVVPTPKVDEAFSHVSDADAVLVAGTSLMVYSSWRFVLHASKLGKKIAIVNMGPTRAEKERERVEHLKLEAPCGDVLKGACILLGGGAAWEADDDPAAAATASSASV